MVTKVVTKIESTIRVWGVFYKKNMQLVLLYGRVSWVVKGYMKNVLHKFHHWVAIRIVGLTARSMTSGEWERPPVADVLETAGLWPIHYYIQQRRATIAVQVEF